MCIYIYIPIYRDTYIYNICIYIHIYAGILIGQYWARKERKHWQKIWRLHMTGEKYQRNLTNSGWPHMTFHYNFHPLTVPSTP